MNKKKKLGLIAGILMLILGITAFSWYSAHKVDARNLALFQVFVQAIDAETNQPLNVSVRGPVTELSEFAGKNGRGVTRAYLEITPDGLVRATWIDFEDSNVSLYLNAEGYETVSVPLDLREKIESYSVLAGIPSPETVALKKTQPEGEGGNGEHHGAGERSQ